MRNISDLKYKISQYVLKNVPPTFPIVSKYIESYISSLLQSSSIQSAFDELHSYTGDGIVFDEEKGDFVSVDCLNFVLRDYCSVVGVSYKAEYKDVIIRAMTQKDLEFLKWLFQKYLSVPCLDIYPLKGGMDIAGVYFSDYLYTITDDSTNKLFTDMLARSQYILVLVFDSKYDGTDTVQNSLLAIWDLLYLVLPARLGIMIEYK